MTRSALVAACEARTVARQWASWDISSPEPLWFERNQYSHGRKLAKQPAKSKDAKLYGYDAEGRVTRIRSWSGFLGKWHEDKLFEWKGRTLTVRGFREDGTPMGISRYTHDAAGRLVRHDMHALQAKRKGSQTFVWKNDLLVRVSVKNWGQSWKLGWTDLGVLDWIATVHAGREHEIYRRPAKGESLPDLLAVIEKRLVELIPAIVARVKPKTHAYALAFVLDEEEWRYLLPPSLVLGLDAKPGLRMWDAAEMFESPALELRDKRLATVCKRANQHIWKSGSYGKVTPMLRRVVAKLQALDWTKQRVVTDDFVVYLTALEGDGDKHVRRDAPLALRKKLRARGAL